MDTQGKAPEFRVNLADYPVPTPFSKAIDQTIETTQAKLDNLFKAIGMVGTLSDSFNSSTGPELEPNHMGPVFQAFSDFGETLMADLKAATAIRGVPAA